MADEWKTKDEKCMSVSRIDDREVTFFLRGELDHHSVKKMREMMDRYLIDYRPDRVNIDLSGVTFTDSAGLGLILGRYTRISGYGGSIQLLGVNDDFMKILAMAGVERLMPIKRADNKESLN